MSGARDYMVGVRLTAEQHARLRSQMIEGESTAAAFRRITGIADDSAPCAANVKGHQAAPTGPTTVGIWLNPAEKAQFEALRREHEPQTVAMRRLANLV